ncbi:hypothetical protein FIBSPDRAFT_972832 [Athelia psychrophila]|uniref:Uncharacterized protein n=1 Tax=Athelia psychrophila TaxID=1759441 RepID=A0A167T3J1_9AGAM|nr:hypothetical protein FIBSPDRAFT_972832 [Fibularhizoctonia sp. CBS 109695]
MAGLQHEYEQSQEVVKMLREKLVVIGGELIDSRARVRELEAGCIKDKQGLKESVKQLLASSQIADMLVLLDKQSKKLKILAEVEHDNTNLQPYLHEKEIEVNSLNSKLNSLNSKIPSLNQTYRLSILEQDIAKGKDTIDNYHSKMGQADTRHQLLQERFDERPLTLRITKEANGDLDVSLNDLDEQLKGCRVLVQSNTHPVDMAVIPQRNTALKLIADKCQTDLMNAALNGQLETLKFEFQRQRDFDKVVASKYQVDLIVAQEPNAVLSGQLESLKRRIEDDLRVQLSLQDPGIPLEVHEKATGRLKEQGRMIVDLTRQATILAARYGDGKLTEPEATFVQSLIMNINQNLESNVKSMYGEVARLLDIQSQNEDTNGEPAVIAKTPQHHLGKAISTCMKTGPTVLLDENAGESSHRQTFATLEADSSDEIVLGKKDRTAVKEAPRTRQSAVDPTLKAKARKRG